MIVTHITNRIKPPPAATWTAPVVNYPALPAVSSPLCQEVLRKDKVIKDLVKDFKHVVGSVVYPKTEEGFKRWGKCQVLGICSEYIHLEKDFKWPKDDNPMIITASSETGEIFYATTNFFKE
jgi:hypothetical protein